MCSGSQEEHDYAINWVAPWHWVSYIGENSYVWPKYIIYFFNFRFHSIMPSFLIEIEQRHKPLQCNVGETFILNW